MNRSQRLQEDSAQSTDNHNGGKQRVSATAIGSSTSVALSFPITTIKSTANQGFKGIGAGIKQGKDPILSRWCKGFNHNIQTTVLWCY